jgi:two-component system KDP operon response regulator KdpE
MSPDSPRILVVDDENQILRALKVVLREAGFEVVPAETAGEALDRASVRPPQAAIVDLVLPDGDGIEVTRRLREWSDMPILVLSAVGRLHNQALRHARAGGAAAGRAAPRGAPRR